MAPTPEDATIRIDAGRPGDVEPFLALLEAAATWLQARGIRQWAPGSMAAQQVAIEALARHGRLIVARSDAAIVGGCLLTPQPGPEWPADADDALYLYKLVVDRQHAGRGLGRRIFESCVAFARADGVARLRLDCWDGNARLRAFYRNCGCRELDAVPVEGALVRRFELDLARGGHPGC